MTYWWIKPGPRPDFDAAHRWGMPGIVCPYCGQTWARTGAALPSISFDGDPLGKKLTGGPISLAQWRRLAEDVRRVVPPSEPIVPGMDFGPLTGELYRPFRVAWHAGWGLVLSAAVEPEFIELAPGVVRVPADLGVPDVYLELEVLTDGVVANMAVTSRCSECGCTDQHLDGDRLVIRDVRRDLPIFRLVNWNASIIAHERLLPFLRRELGDQGEFEEVDLVS